MESNSFQEAINNVRNFGWFEWIYFGGLVLNYAVIIALLMIFKYKK